ncbi:MAG: hypothetical protein RAO92_07010 [Candidatus Euphemobacter frigidus]|nr:hypothetical protein [Candidatus Euphemobacter frigidus]MDP8276136.1 hypothetical protein [Candidatus Euphemobacter frigidus]
MIKGNDRKKLIEIGIKVGNSDMYDEDKIWALYSSDKIDIGEVLMKVIRTLDRELPLSRELRALSIGSGSEPQFRILEPTARGGLYLLDIDSVPLGIVKEQLRREWIKHVTTIRVDYNRVLIRAQKVEQFVKNRLGGKKLDLIVLHHSLYYSRESEWEALIENLYRKILASRGAIHAVMMASECQDQYSTTWLYNHFAGKYFGCRNDQDLKAFGKGLKKNKIFNKAVIDQRTHRVRFFVDDFGKFMSVIWMILLYPNVHKYTRKQREEITENIYDKFWLKKIPLNQMQDHLVVYKRPA